MQRWWQVQHAPAIPSSGGEPVAVHNPRLQTMRYGPGGQVYDQQSAVGADSDTARVAHLQYNTPLGLYSRQNAQDALQSQTGGKAGYGTMQYEIFTYIFFFYKFLQLFKLFVV